MNAKVYNGVMREHMGAYLNSHPDLSLFHRNGAKHHTSEIVVSCLKDQEVAVMKWPAYFFDLNPMENIWAGLNQRTNKLMDEVYTIQNLEQMVRQEWKKFGKKEVRKFISQIPARYETIVQNNGKYLDD